jgi:hypothetical protein
LHPESRLRQLDVHLHARLTSVGDGALVSGATSEAWKFEEAHVHFYSRCDAFVFAYDIEIERSYSDESMYEVHEDGVFGIMPN